MREFKRITDKAGEAKSRIKRDQSSISPDGRAGKIDNETDNATKYVKKLASVA